MTRDEMVHVNGVYTTIIFELDGYEFSGFGMMIERDQKLAFIFIIRTNMAIGITFETGSKYENLQYSANGWGTVDRRFVSLFIVCICIKPNVKKYSYRVMHAWY